MSGVSAFSTRSERARSPAIFGYSALPSRLSPAAACGTQMITTEYDRPLSLTVVVHVVQPWVWPAVSSACSVTSPSTTSSPSCSTRSTATGSQPISPTPVRSLPDDSAGASSAITMTCAPVARFIAAWPSTWSQCAWLLRMIFTSVSLNPSLTMLDCTIGSISRVPVSSRIKPPDVANRYDAMLLAPT